MLIFILKGKIKNARKYNDQVLLSQLEAEKKAHIQNARYLLLFVERGF